MSPNKFFALLGLVSILGIGAWFFHTLPPSVIFNRSRPVATQAQPSPTPFTRPSFLALPSPAKIGSTLYSMKLPQQKVQFSYPAAWGTPSASFTKFVSPDAGTLTGVYFLGSKYGDTPAFLEFTSNDYKLASPPSTLFSQTKNSLTTAIMSQNGATIYYVYAPLPQYHLKAYVYLPEIQDNLPSSGTDIESYFKSTSEKIFSGAGLSATDSAIFRDFQKLIKSIKPI